MFMYVVIPITEDPRDPYEQTTDKFDYLGRGGGGGGEVQSTVCQLTHHNCYHTGFVWPRLAIATVFMIVLFTFQIILL